MTHTTSTAQAVSTSAATAVSQPVANSNDDKARFPFAIVGQIGRAHV